ncbi:hypothetical protein SAMN05443661_10122 [Natronobacterium gregoryi]|uniref:Uncharacterized protein n=2 Tax=Natronobacterium gregoryi TaxID=44930 RepID=L0AK32_NATGS|nr:hypothetical protein Natgr_3002 [Natronobacterium gregoryi SP2]SFI50127.1 hypothetical protein SAMN05443661_10122 [Natronobacterium gregoryi]
MVTSSEFTTTQKLFAEFFGSRTLAFVLMSWGLLADGMLEASPGMGVLVILSRDLQEFSLGQAEVTPVETATAVETNGGWSSSVPASHVIETGSHGTDPRRFTCPARLDFALTRAISECYTGFRHTGR